MTLSDPVLDGHHAENEVFLLSGPSPISMRDQVVRARLLVERLLERGFISTNGVGPKLAVIGAGLGGATAAVHAARMGVQTLLVEQRSEPFTAQSFTGTRYFDSTQYDWPVDHWHYGRFPWDNSHVDFKLPHMTGRLLYQMWRVELRQYESQLANLTISYNRRVTNITKKSSKSSQLEVDHVDHLPDEFSAIIWAVGVGEEDCFLPARDPTLRQYEGQAFWVDDHFEDLHKSPRRVLISGSGDGALQDYIRIQTGEKTAADVFNTIYIPEPIKRRLLSKIQSAEDRTLRAWSWSKTDLEWKAQRDRCTKIHSESVDELLRIPAVEKSLASVVKNISIKIAVREEYLSAFYGLNRFLTLLLSQFLDRNTNPADPVLLYNTTVVSIRSGDSHNCLALKAFPPKFTAQELRAAGRYDSNGRLQFHNCYCALHEVEFSSALKENFDVVVVRHGLYNKPSRPGSLSPYELPPRSRHLLPYDL